MDRYPIVPWGDLEASDMRESKAGYWQRDVRGYGMRERQVALHVIGSYDTSLSLGLIAIRCDLAGGRLDPMTLSIPERWSHNDV